MNFIMNHDAIVSTNIKSVKIFPNFEPKCQEQRGRNNKHKHARDIMQYYRVTKKKKRCNMKAWKMIHFQEVFTNGWNISFRNIYIMDV